MATIQATAKEVLLDPSMPSSKEVLLDPSMPSSKFHNVLALKQELQSGTKNTAMTLRRYEYSSVHTDLHTLLLIIILLFK